MLTFFHIGSNLIFRDSDASISSSLASGCSCVPDIERFPFFGELSGRVLELEFGSRVFFPLALPSKEMYNGEDKADNNQIKMLTFHYLAVFAAIDQGGIGHS